jgi:hypothetical protein
MDKAELFALTARLRRATHLPDVIALCDEAERMALGVVSTPAPVVSTQAPIASAVVSTSDCPVCEARRFAKAAVQRRWRNKESLSANG